MDTWEFGPALRRRRDGVAPDFGALWEAPAPPLPSEPTRRRTVTHPAAGRITLDGDTLVVALDDLRITVHTAEPGTEDADRLAPALVLGPQSFQVTDA